LLSKLIALSPEVVSETLKLIFNKLDLNPFEEMAKSYNYYITVQKNEAAAIPLCEDFASTIITVLDILSKERFPLKARE
jgi:hypothetical protein